jgi:hypothetical protein
MSSPGTSVDTVTDPNGVAHDEFTFAVILFDRPLMTHLGASDPSTVGTGLSLRAFLPSASGPWVSVELPPSASFDAKHDPNSTGLLGFWNNAGPEAGIDRQAADAKGVAFELEQNGQAIAWLQGPGHNYHVDDQANAPPPPAW